MRRVARDGAGRDRFFIGVLSRCKRAGWPGGLRRLGARWTLPRLPGHSRRTGPGRRARGTVGPMAAARTSTCVALLRGLNVGARKRLAMPELVSAFEAAGALAVATYIQSGNVIFRSGADEAAKVATRVRAALSGRLGFDVPVVIRTGAQLRAVARANPFLAAGADPSALHVLFLADRPAATRVSSLYASRSRRDRFAVAGREVYLHCPDGIGRSKLTGDYFEGRLATTATARNWRTVTALVEMAGA